VERLVDETSRRHSAELQTLRAACEKHTKELQVRLLPPLLLSPFLA